MSDAQVTALEEEAKKLKKAQTQNKVTFKHSQTSKSRKGKRDEEESKFSLGAS